MYAQKEKRKTNFRVLVSSALHAPDGRVEPSCSSSAPELLLHQCGSAQEKEEKEGEAVIRRAAEAAEPPERRSPKRKLARPGLVLEEGLDGGHWRIADGSPPFGGSGPPLRRSPKRKGKGQRLHRAIRPASLPRHEVGLGRLAARGRGKGVAGR